jgi:argininosuccinate lyase
MSTKNKKDIPDLILRIIYGDPSDVDFGIDLNFSTDVDLAHLVMLETQNLIPAKAAQKITKEIYKLKKSGFAPLREKPMKRGAYIAYENYLTSTLGIGVAGYLHTGRSRNDLQATIFRLRIRDAYRRVVPQILALERTILGLAAKHTKTPAVIHTQMQPAMPGTFGHFFCGIGEALDAQSEEILRSYALNEISPLGAGAAGGTSLPIDPALSAQLLGFNRTVKNSLCGVAHYEYVLNMMAALSAYAAVLHQLTTTLHLWATREFGFVTFSKSATGTSSMLPQKRNPFILEIIKAKITAMNGTMVSTLQGLHGVPFSNAIESKAAARQFYPFLNQFGEVLTLTQYVLENMNVSKKIPGLDTKYTDCLALYQAEEKVKNDGMPFRSAYNSTVQDMQTKKDKNTTAKISTAAEAFKYGGGPASGPTKKAITALQARLLKRQSAWNKRQDAWKRAEKILMARTKAQTS